MARRRGGRVGGEERVAGTRGKDHDPALLEMTNRPPPDEGLGHLVHLDGGLNAGRNPDLLEGRRQGEGIDDRRQHPHGVTGDAIDALLVGRDTADDVAATHDDGDLHTEFGHLGDFIGDVLDDLRLDTEGLRTHEGLARQLEHDSGRYRGSAEGSSSFASALLTELESDKPYHGRVRHRRSLRRCSPTDYRRCPWQRAARAGPRTEELLHLAVDDLFGDLFGLALLHRLLEGDLVLGREQIRRSPRHG